MIKFKRCKLLCLFKLCYSFVNTSLKSNFNIKLVKSKPNLEPPHWRVSEYIITWEDCSIWLKGSQDCYRFWDWILWVFSVISSGSVHIQTYLCLCECLWIDLFFKIFGNLCYRLESSFLSDKHTLSANIFHEDVIYLFQSPPILGSFHKIKQLNLKICYAKVNFKLNVLGAHCTSLHRLFDSENIELHDICLTV